MQKLGNSVLTLTLKQLTEAANNLYISFSRSVSSQRGGREGTDPIAAGHGTALKLSSASQRPRQNQNTATTAAAHGVAGAHFSSQNPFNSFCFTTEICVCICSRKRRPG